VVVYHQSSSSMDIDGKANSRPSSNIPTGSDELATSL